MYEVVSGHFYLPKWAGPTSDNTFHSTKNLAIYDMIGLKKSKMVFLSNSRANIYKFCQFLKINIFDIIVTQVNIPSH